MDNEAALETFCREFAVLDGPRVLVHGGGVAASRVQEMMGLKPVKIQGRRVTDEETLKVVTGVYAGLCNKKLVALLQKYGCNAIGLSGCDGNVICASRRPAIEIEGRMVDFGAVGDVTAESVNTELIEGLCGIGLVPVLSAINHDGQGNLLNTNADTVASSVAAALGAELVVCFEKNGVLRDKDDEGSVIPEIDEELFGRLKAEGIVAEGMIPKLDNAFRCLRDGASGVTIRNSSGLGNGIGTKIRKYGQDNRITKSDTAERNGDNSLSVV